MRTSTNSGTLLRLTAAAGALLCWAGVASAQQATNSAVKDAERKAQPKPALTPEERAYQNELELKLRQAALDASQNSPGLRGPGPVNDLCTGAIDLATVGFAAGANIVVASTDVGATADATAGCGVGTTAAAGANGVWYSLVGTGNRVTISTCADTVDRVARVYCGTCAALSCVAGDDDGCVTGTSLATLVSFCTTAGTTYYVQLSRFTASATGAAFNFSVVDNNTACPATAQANCAGLPPVNDVCANAVGISIGSSYEGTLAGATVEAPSNPACTVVTTNPGVWHSVVGDGTILRATTCNTATGGNTAIAVFSGSCASLTCVGGNLVLAGCGAGRDDNATVDWTSANGTTYYIWVSGESTITLGAGASDYQLSVTSIGIPATNDLCATATPILVPSSGNFNNVGASADTVPCGGTNSTGVWFSLTGNGNKLRVSTCGAGTTLNTKIGVYTGSCAAPVCVDSNATASPACTPNTAAQLDFCSENGTTYYILVSGDTTGNGVFDLSVSDQGACIAGDICGGAVPLTIGTPVVSNNTGGTNDLAAALSCGGVTTGNGGVWYSVVGDGTVLQASTCGAGTVIDTSLRVFSGSCAAPVCVNGNTAAVPACTPSSAASINFCSTLGTTYYILVSGAAVTQGAYQIGVTSVGPCVANDLCSNATTLAVPSTTIVSNLGATTDTGAPTCTTTLGTAGVWYRVVGNGNNFVADTCTGAPGNFDTRLSVYCASQSATPCANLAALPCITGIDNATLAPPNGCGTGSQQSRVNWCTQNGAVYFILLHGGTGTQGAQGSTTLTLQDTGSCTLPISCAATGACCASGGACTITTQAACTGSYLGDNTTCFPPTGSPTSYSNAPSLAIPDNQCATGFVTDTITVADTYTVGDVNVTVNIPAHTFVGDLRINLIHGATTIRLWNNQCGTSANLGVTFDDEGGAVVCTEPVLGTFRPVDSLGAFDGSSVNGAWTLQLCDNAGADTGILTDWSLSITAAGPSPCPTGPDCYTRGPVSGSAACSPTYTPNAYNRPTNAGHFTVGGGNGATDTSECISDWDGNGCILPSDVAAFVTSAFYDFSNGTADAQITCGGGPTVPATVASFVTRWFNALSNPAGDGCTP